MMSWIKYTIDKHPGLEKSFQHKTIKDFPLHKTNPFSPPLLNNGEQRNPADFQFAPCSPSFNVLRRAKHLVPTSADEMQQTYHPLALILLEINTQRKSLVKMHAMFL